VRAQGRPRQPPGLLAPGLCPLAQRQYASAGAVFELGLKAAADKKDKKRQDEMTTIAFVIAELFNPGISALSRAAPD